MIKKSTVFRLFVSKIIVIYFLGENIPLAPKQYEGMRNTKNFLVTIIYYASGALKSVILFTKLSYYVQLH